MGLNELQTLLRDAVKEENFDNAILYRDELAERISSGAYTSSGEVDRRKTTRLSWRGLGTAPWLEDRLSALNYKFPTTIQINAFESVNSMLGALDENKNKETLEELMERQGQGNNMGVVISGSTGSGKTLAYLVPMLSTLSESLFTRQRIRVKSEEDIGDAADDLMARVAIQTSPTVRGHGRNQVGGKSGTIATGASLSSMGKSGTDVKNALSLIVVPTRELGVQTALILYELVGGSTKKTASEMAGMANMFKVSTVLSISSRIFLSKAFVLKNDSWTKTTT
jgi:superfamily II DNA/RNA helicase